MSAQQKTPFHVFSRTPRTVGTEVMILNFAADDSPYEAESGDQWGAACVTHAVIIAGPTRRGITELASAPTIWCPGCLVAYEAKLNPNMVVAK